MNKRLEENFKIGKIFKSSLYILISRSSNNSLNECNDKSRVAKQHKA